MCLNAPVFVVGGGTAADQGQKTQDGASFFSAAAETGRGGGAYGDSRQMEPIGSSSSTRHKPRPQGAAVERLRPRQQGRDR